MIPNYRPSNSQRNRLPAHENIQVVREVFEQVKSQIPMAAPVLPFEFQFNYALHIKTNWPQIWGLCNAGRSNVEQTSSMFDLWQLYREGVKNEEVDYWANKARYRYYCSHKRNNFTINAIMTAIKWSVVLDIGEEMMFKNVVREAIRKKLINFEKKC